MQQTLRQPVRQKEESTDNQRNKNNKVLYAPRIAGFS